MATKAQAQQDQDEFSAAFNEPDQAKTEQTEDEAFGIAPENNEAPGIQEAQAQSSDSSAAESGDSSAGTAGAPAVAIVVEPGAEADGSIEAPTDPKDIQREKTWEGRLRAKEAELKAREEALAAKEHGEAPGQAETPAQEAAEPVAEEAMETPEQESAEHPGEAAEPMAEEQGEAPGAEKMEQVAEAYKSGDMSAEEAMKTLSMDFGPDFAKMLGTIIESKAKEIAGQLADEKLGPVGGRLDQVGGKLDGLIGELVDDRQKKHFESIADTHPDYMEIGDSPEFREYVEAMPEEEKAAVMEVIGKGSAKQINALLTAYKGSKKEAEPDQVDQGSMDAAEGVRSAGLKLPNKPAMSDDYEAAWDQF